MYASKNLDNRKNWVEKTLKSLPKGLKIIDVGAGECQYKVHCEHLEYVSQDFNEYNGIGDSNGLQTGKWDISRIDIVSDITMIPVETGSFDVVLCTEVLEHVPDPVSALNEMNRILKNNGLIIITAPFCSLTHFAPYHFCDGFNKYFYDYHLKRLGYNIIEMTPNGDYYDYLTQELYRLPNVVKKYSFRKTLLIKIISWVLIKILNTKKYKKNNSNELACFGYHVIAKKSS